MQNSYLATIYELLKNDKNVILCLSDSGTDYEEIIMREFPDQIVNFGISENNKVGAAAGLASCDKMPFLYTTSAFLVYRSYEFIRDDICLQNKNVKLIGMGTGLSWSTLGPTHHATEDISALKALPNLVVLSPCSPKELEESIRWAYRHIGPVYIRMGMSNEAELYEPEQIPDLSKISTLYTPINGSINSTAIFTTGPIAEQAIIAAKHLSDCNINVEVVNVAMLKPMDEQGIQNVIKKYNKIFSVEEHNIVGGLGSSIADIMAKTENTMTLNKIGLQDCFAKGYGTYSEVLKQNNLTAAHIEQIIKQNFNN